MRRVRVTVLRAPFPSIRTSRFPSAATTSSPYGRAEVTWPASARGSAALPVAASTRTTRVSLRAERSSANCENTAVSSVPHPGEK